MPEGPEIYLAARKVHDAVSNQPCTLTLHYPPLAKKSANPARCADPRRACAEQGHAH